MRTGKTIIVLLVAIALGMMLFGCTQNNQNNDSDTNQPSGDDNAQIVGGDKDEHGCIGSAGYTWCEALKQCIRPWETECVADSDDNTNETVNGISESDFDVTEEGTDEVMDESEELPEEPAE